MRQAQQTCCSQFEASEGTWCLQAKHLTQEAYAMNHPAGRIGKRLMLRVRDLMLTHPQLPLAHPEDSIMQVPPSLPFPRHPCFLQT